VFHSKQILTGSILLLLAVSASAGTTAKLQPAPEPKAEKKGLVFADGLLTLDIEERLRFEARNNNRDFDDSINDDNDDSWVLSRFRLGLAIKPSPWLKLYAQTQDTREWDSDRPNTPGLRGTEGQDNFDLRQAYIEIGNLKEFPLSLTVGRQVLNYGDARILADGNWSNFGRTFDAVKLRYQRKGFGTVDLFAARPVQIKEEVFNDSDAEDNFFGLYASLDVLSFQTTDIYVLHRDKNDIQSDLDPTNRIDPRGTWNGPANRITTIGTRWVSKKGALGDWDYGLEAAYQFGDYWNGDRIGDALDHQAFAIHLRGGYTWENLSWKPRVGLEYNYATGDKDPTDGDNESFQNLFPSNFAPYGYIDEFSWRNMHNARLHLTAQPTKKLTVELSYHAFWLAETSDYWYRSNGQSTLRTRTPGGADVRTIGASNFAGHEIDLAFTYKPTDRLTIFTGYSHFFAGDYLSDTGPSDDADFAYLQATIAF
jgi:hypothetical protein